MKSSVMYESDEGLICYKINTAVSTILKDNHMKCLKLYNTVYTPIVFYEIFFNSYNVMRLSITELK